MYFTIPSIEAKDSFVIELTKSIFDLQFEITGFASMQKFYMI